MVFHSGFILLLLLYKTQRNQLCIDGASLYTPSPRIFENFVIGNIKINIIYQDCTTVIQTIAMLKVSLKRCLLRCYFAEKTYLRHCHQLSVAQEVS